MSPQELLDEFNRIAGQGQGITITHRSGEHRVTRRDDGSYTGRRDQWHFGGTAQGTLVTTIAPRHTQVSAYRWASRARL